MGNRERWTRLLAVGAVAVIGAAGAPGRTGDAPGAGAGATAGTVASREEVARTPRFAFHSDPWMNLHHFLYQWSRAEAGIGTGRQAVAVPERAHLADLPDADRRVWREAVDLYREELAERGHFDDRMLEVKGALLEADDDRDRGARLDGLVPGLGQRLAAAADVYRRRWWRDHDAVNRRWVEGILPRLQRHEAFGVATLERATGGVWEGRLRVDVSVYGNWAGGYTSNGPAHTVVLSTDPRNQGWYGLELLMHEPGHVSALGRPLRTDLSTAFQARGERPPDNLSHAILFFTAGWITGAAAREEGAGPHVPYAVEQGLVGFQGWEGLWPALEAHWRPFLDGDLERSEALAGLAEALATGGGVGR